MRFPLRFEIFARRYLNSFEMRKTEEVGVARMMGFLLQPSASARGARYISRIEETDDWIKTYVDGFSEPIYWPREEKFSTMKEIVGEQFYPLDWHRYLIPETPVLSGDTVVDCGAAEGLFSYLAAPVATKVFAIEPVPRFQDAMRLTFANHPHVEIVPFALDSKNGEADLLCRSASSNIRGISGSGTEARISVKVVTLDDLFAGQTIDYLKADIEGLEVDVLQGAKEVIYKSKPRVAITTYHHSDHAKQIEELLKTIHPSYRIKLKGTCVHGTPQMLHAWIQ